jgi:hypothetical protein
MDNIIFLRNNSRHALSWPASDFFFGYGIKSLVARLKQTSETSEFFFINLNCYTLKAFFKEFAGFRSEKIIIISSRRLMPLAFFWLTESEKVCAVFESSVSAEEVIKAINDTPPQGKIPFPLLRTSDKLTFREVFFLKNYLEKGKLAEIQINHSMKYSTLKNWKASIARKLGARKLEHLLVLR